jgi:hypothetical protein
MELVLAKAPADRLALVSFLDELVARIDGIYRGKQDAWNSKEIAAGRKALRFPSENICIRLNRRSFCIFCAPVCLRMRVLTSNMNLSDSSAADAAAHDAQKYNNSLVLRPREGDEVMEERLKYLNALRKDGGISFKRFPLLYFLCDITDSCSGSHVESIKFLNARSINAYIMENRSDCQHTYHWRPGSKPGSMSFMTDEFYEADTIPDKGIVSMGDLKRHLNFLLCEVTGKADPVTNPNLKMNHSIVRIK